MAKQCDGSSCSNCTEWEKCYTHTHIKNFHLCSKLSIFTYGSFYCAHHESVKERQQRRDDDYFDEEYS